MDTGGLEGVVGYPLHFVPFPTCSSQTTSIEVAKSEVVGPKGTQLYPFRPNFVLLDSSSSFSIKGKPSAQLG